MESTLSNCKFEQLMLMFTTFLTSRNFFPDSALEAQVNCVNTEITKENLSGMVLPEDFIFPLWVQCLKHSQDNKKTVFCSRVDKMPPLSQQIVLLWLNYHS